MYNIVEPKVEVCKASGLEKIELIGKVCTKMEHTIKEGSAKTFVINRIQEGHNAILMHEFAYFDVSLVNIHIKRNLLLLCPYIKFSKHLNYIAINYRSLVDLMLSTKELLRRHTIIDFYDDVCDLFYSIFFQVEEFSSLFYDFDKVEFDFINNGRNNIYYQNIERVSSEHILEVAPEIYIVTLKFTTDRGVSHEIVRHTIMAFMQESTRWCDYCKDRNGSSINIVTPFDDFSSDIDDASKLWYDTISTIGATYKDLVKVHGWKAEQARSVLPNATKTEIYVTGTLEEWIGDEIDMEIGRLHIKESKGFLPQRTAKQAHYQMKEVADMAESNIKEIYNIYANNI